jgi:hypothetical protein
MSYSVWKNGQKIGETRFELCPAPRKRAGVFHPTAFGLSVLPGITAMGPALRDFGEMCRKRGVDVDDNRPETAERAFDAFGETPEARRIQAAASCIADLELRDANGRTLGWESIMITDMNTLAELAEKRRRGAPDQLSMLPGDPIRFMISTTLADVPDPRRRATAVAGESIGIC